MTVLAIIVCSVLAVVALFQLVRYLKILSKWDYAEW